MPVVRLGPGIMRVAGAAAPTFVVVLLVCAAALATRPVKGAMYTGTWTRGAQISVVTFKVSADGRSVMGTTLPNNEPVFCQGGGFGLPLGQAKAARISRSGRFSVKLELYFAPAKQNQGTVTVAGRFLPRSRASGTVTTAFTKVKACNGKVTFKAAVAKPV